MSHVIVTIGREFGSGGREFGRRLAEELGIAYYDKEILLEIDKRTPYSLSYIQNVSENRPVVLPPINYGNSFLLYKDAGMEQHTDVFRTQSDILKEISEKGSCVIIGRGADYVLRDKHPYRIFVYADIASRIERCKKRANDEEKTYTDKKWTRYIRSVDKKRRAFYDFYTGVEWGRKENYDLMVNTTNGDIKAMAHHCAMMIKDLMSSEER